MSKHNSKNSSMGNSNYGFPLKISHITSGFLAVLVGYTSSVAIIFQAASAVGADQASINSWLLSLGLGMGLTCIGLSFYYKKPILTAWSTPGAALLATSLVGVSMSDAIGAFLFSAVLITLSGLTGSFERISKIISPSIAAAMLAGVLVQFCLEIFTYLQQEFLLVASMCIVYLLGRRFFALYAIPLALVVGVLIAWALDLFSNQEITLELAQFVFTMPTFSLSSLISIGIPLFIVTMTSQNMPGIVVMKAADYHPPISPIITVTGITTFLLAPFGGFAFNLAAITAAICMGEDAGKDRDKRYLAAVSAGVFYLIAALFGATVVALFSISPKALVLPLAGLALLGTLGNSLAQALELPKEREAALITFLVTSSGFVFYGVGSAFWGLVAGMLVQQIIHQVKK
ncbi:MAG: benzoate membrane transport protein [Cocleimonas sp.]|jgi:benzoate membrane transport protein